MTKGSQATEQGRPGAKQAAKRFTSTATTAPQHKTEEIKFIASFLPKPLNRFQIRLACFRRHARTTER